MIGATDSMTVKSNADGVAGSRKNMRRLLAEIGNVEPFTPEITRPSQLYEHTSNKNNVTNFSKYDNIIIFLYAYERPCFSQMRYKLCLNLLYVR